MIEPGQRLGSTALSGAGTLGPVGGSDECRVGRGVGIPRTLWLLVGGGFAVILGAGAFLALQTDAQEARALRTPGAIVAVTTGSEPLVLGAGWQKALLRLFPQLQGRIGGAFLRPNFARAQSVMIWHNRGPLSSADGGSPDLTLTLTGDRGETMSAVPATLDAQQVGNAFLILYDVTTFPRRGTHVRVHCNQGGAAEPHQPDLVVSNPAPGRYPVWVPDPLPAIRRSGDLEVTLDRLETGVVRSENRHPSAPETGLDLRIRERGRPAARWWSVENATLADPTGNSWENLQSALALTNERRPVRMNVPLLPNEPALRMRLDLARVDRFPPEDLWILRDLPVPPPGRIVRISRRRKLHGCALELTHLIGARSDYIFGWSSNSAAAAIKISGPVSHFCLRGKTDANGGYRDDSPFQTDPSQPYCVYLNVEKGGPVTLKLALTPRHTVEFLAHASRPGTPAPPHRAAKLP